MPAHEIQEIITDLQMEINEEEGLQYSIPEEAWYDPDTGKKYPKSHGRDKATALFKQRISVFGTHKVPEPGVAMEQYKAVAHDKAQSEPQHQRKNQKKVAEVTDDDKAATVARKLEEKMETAKRMEEQRKAKQEAKHAAKLAKAKAEANARAEKFKADPLSRWK